VRRHRILDVGCCAGGAAVGYDRPGYSHAGFEVVGLDIAPQPNFPFEFIQADGLEFLADPANLEPFDAIHCSWPCQKDSLATLSQRRSGREYPDLITPGRKLLQAQPRPWVMENVPQSSLRPDIRLCGCMFGLEVEVPGIGVCQLQRERVFETSWRDPGLTPAHSHHGPAISVCGHGTPSWMRKRTGHVPVALWREVMGIDWTTRAELAEAVPPAYGEFVGGRLMEVLEMNAEKAA
jgi:DNA (cytosine-5)-methyltransferase 1